MGETGYGRWKSHLGAISTNDETNALVKHFKVQHDNIVQELDMKILGNYITCLERQSAEAVKIAELLEESNIIINSRSEQQIDVVSRKR